MRKGIFERAFLERAYLNWHYRKDILMKDISERAFPKGHFDEGHFEGRAFPKGERAKGMKGIVHKLEFPQIGRCGVVWCGVVESKGRYISTIFEKETAQNQQW